MSQIQRTIHVARDQWHLAWDQSIPPLATIASGETISFDLLDASCGQITPEATVATIGALDFSQVDQVNGPIFVEGARPGDTLEIEFLEMQPAEWGWTALIPGFGLLADEFPDPALKLWRLRDGWAEFAQASRFRSSHSVARWVSPRRLREPSRPSHPIAMAAISIPNTLRAARNCISRLRWKAPCSR